MPLLEKVSTPDTEPLPVSEGVGVRVAASVEEGASLGVQMGEAAMLGEDVSEYVCVSVAAAEVVEEREGVAAGGGEGGGAADGEAHIK